MATTTSDATAGRDARCARGQRAAPRALRMCDAGVERFLEWSDGELLGLLAGTGPEGALRALAAFGGLSALSQAGVAALVELGGLRRSAGRRILAAIELGRRVGRASLEPRSAVRGPSDVAELMRPRIGSLDHEELWVVSLDGRSGLRGLRCVARGGLHGCAVGAREVLRAALLDAASAFVLVHNHPSGDPQPSAEDVEMTRRSALAGAAAGMPLVDHVVIAPSGRFVSLCEAGLLPELALAPDEAPLHEGSEHAEHGEPSRTSRSARGAHVEPRVHARRPGRRGCRGRG